MTETDNIVGPFLCPGNRENTGDLRWYCEVLVCREVDLKSLPG